MNLNEIWIKKITTTLINCGNISVVPGRGEPYKISFDRDGEIKGSSITSYKVVWDNTKKTPCIRLSNDNGLLAVCHISSNGDIKGRDRESNGYLLLRYKEVHRPEFQSLHNAKKLADIVVADEENTEFRYKEPLSEQYDWSEYVWDLSKKIDRTLLINSPTAIALAVCDRPLYFKKVVQSLAHNVEANQYPIFGFFDKPEKEDDEVVQHQINLLLDHFPDAVIIKRPRNFGCGRNLIDVRRQLFDNMGYERVYVFEDDMVLSKYYIKYVDSLLDWAQHKYTNIGAVQGWSHCTLNRSDRVSRLDVIKGTYTTWWGYCMTKSAWNSINSSMYRYEDLFLGGAYRYRPHETILHWFKMKMNDAGIIGSRSFPTSEALVAERNNYFSGPPTGQDAATMHLFEIAGWSRICSIINRGKYIGKKGIHMNDNLWSKFGYEGMLFEDYTQDTSMDEFRLLEDSQEVEVVKSPFKGFSYRKD